MDVKCLFQPLLFIEKRVKFLLLASNPPLFCASLMKCLKCQPKVDSARHCELLPVLEYMQVKSTCFAIGPNLQTLFDLCFIGGTFRRTLAFAFYSDSTH